MQITIPDGLDMSKLRRMIARCPQATQTSRAVEWMRNTLEAGPMRAEEFYTSGAKAGFSRSLLKSARGRAGIVARRDSDCWWVALGEDKDTPLSFRDLVLDVD